MPKIASSPAISQACDDGATAGQNSAAGTASMSAAATWLPAAIASGGTAPRPSFLVRLGEMPYDIVASRHAAIAQAEPPGARVGLVPADPDDAGEANRQAEHSQKRHPVAEPEPGKHDRGEQRRRRD